MLASNLIESVEFWKARCGFTANLWGDPPDFAILRRDGMHLMLSQKPAGHEIIPNWHIKDKLWNAYFWVDDAKALHAEFVAAGAPIDYGPCVQDYGVLEFGIQDPDGRDIAFGQSLD